MGFNFSDSAFMGRRNAVQGVDLADLKAYWKFDETSGDVINQAGTVGSVDSLGSGADIQITGATYNQAESPFGYSMLFDGVNDLGIFGSSLSQFGYMSDDNGISSLNFWYKFGTANQGTNYLIQNSVAGTEGFYYQIRAGATNQYSLRFNTFDGGADISTTLADVGAYNDISNYHMATITWDENGGSNNLKFYLDAGTPVTGTTGTTTRTGNAEMAARLVERSTVFLHIYLTEMSSWNRILSVDEISALYNSGNGLEL